MANEEACPVDHKTREAWLEQARAKGQAGAATATQQPTACPVNHDAPESKSWSQTISSYLWSSSDASNSCPVPTSEQKNGLGTNRVVSTIPRTATASPIEHGASANHEVETGADVGTGNWVYPSEKMFFDAMKRKGYEAHEVDMKTVVPIHNAVNEKAWEQIKAWEAPYLEKSQCGGPKLESFANKSDRMTPTARFNTVLGYTAPFDRHDWVIDRCGTRVDYVIDFYSGRGDGKAGPSFYLDVRPKFNTWEGVKMRAMRWTGLA